VSTLAIIKPTHYQRLGFDRRRRSLASDLDRRLAHDSDDRVAISERDAELVELPDGRELHATGGGRVQHAVIADGEANCDERGIDAIAGLVHRRPYRRC